MLKCLRTAIIILFSVALGVACALLAGCSTIRVVERIDCGHGYTATLTRAWGAGDTDRAVTMTAITAVVFGACAIKASGGR